MNTARINITIPAEVKEEWQVYATEKGMSLSKFIRHAVNVYITAMKRK